MGIVAVYMLLEFSKGNEPRETIGIFIIFFILVVISWNIGYIQVHKLEDKDIGFIDKRRNIYFAEISEVRKQILYIGDPSDDADRWKLIKNGKCDISQKCAYLFDMNMFSKEIKQERVINYTFNMEADEDEFPHLMTFSLVKKLYTDFVNENYLKSFILRSLGDKTTELNRLSEQVSQSIKNVYNSKHNFLSKSFETKMTADVNTLNEKVGKFKEGSISCSQLFENKVKSIFGAKIFSIHIALSGNFQKDFDDLQLWLKDQTTKNKDSASLARMKGLESILRILESPTTTNSLKQEGIKILSDGENIIEPVKSNSILSPQSQIKPVSDANKLLLDNHIGAIAGIIKNGFENKETHSEIVVKLNDQKDIFQSFKISSLKFVAECEVRDRSKERYLRTYEWYVQLVQSVLNDMKAN